MTQSIEKLQKKLDKAPNSTIFFQLAEEHRKEGNLDEALKILKEGLTRHPSYWSARVTLRWERRSSQGKSWRK
jgi:tetratricopeptide (TPR) repeat protein